VGFNDDAMGLQKIDDDSMPNSFGNMLNSITNLDANIGVVTRASDAALLQKGYVAVFDDLGKRQVSLYTDAMNRTSQMKI